MALDLRIVIGRLLLAIGVQLLLYGLWSEGRAASMNLLWGGILAAAGAVFHLLRRFRRPA
jgi:hypothetical protein